MSDTSDIIHGYRKQSLLQTERLPVIADTEQYLARPPFGEAGHLKAPHNQLVHMPQTHTHTRTHTTCSYDQ